ncbi:MAG: OmpA family protein [Elusimicrobia bacterium]|nr:OmpA family protein [Elusimicrobiota bacterium]
MKNKTVHYGRIGSDPSEEDSNLWLLCYSSMMTLLMVFFLILYALSYNAQIKLVDHILAKKLERFGEIILTANKIDVTFSQDIVFEKASPEVSNSFKGVLTDVSDYLKGNAGTVVISGHADSTPLIGGKYKDNWYLSAERGWSVASELINQGIDPKRLQIRGYGEFKPVASNETEAGRAKNRRIEMSIHKIKMGKAEKFIYYKTQGKENISRIAKKYLGDESYSERIRTLNPDKIDDHGTVLENTEILIPFEP